MKKFLILLAALFIGLGLYLASLDSPVKNLESLAIRHADKLPLAYLGEKLFDEHCASCHDNPAAHAPTRVALSGFSRESVMIALGFGKMQPMAAHLSKQEQFLIAVYLSGAGGDDSSWIAQNSCDAVPAESATRFVTNWGLGDDNRRYAGPSISRISRDNVDQLELAWTLAFPKVTDMRSQPAIIGNTLYFGDKTGKLYALDRKQGCVLKHTQVLSGIRSAITAITLDDGTESLVFADSLASIFAVDPQTLEVRWQHSARLFDTSVITGSISYHNGRLFVPISSYEVAVSGSPTYACCRSHGGLIALDAQTGDRLWEWHAAEDASLQGQTSAGVDIYGPSGASVWTTPAIDPKRQRIYFGTGENMTHPATDTSDAIIALDMATGKLAWKFQATVGDVWNAGCLGDGPNCPEDPGGDFDFGASVIMATDVNGRELLLAGQKSGEVYALNPDTENPKGDLLWKQRVSDGTTNGGIHWGMSLSGNTLVVPVADPERDREGYTPRPGLYALDLASGEILWEQPVSRGCDMKEENKPLIGLENTRSTRKISLEDQYSCSFYYGLSAASTTTDTLAFSAGLNGVLRAYDLESGEILWETISSAPFQGVNGIEGHGGAVDVGGQVLAGDWLYLQSGYSMFGQLPGNVLLAYRLKTAN
jgi:polyvinyl alcohol dehydrogenase (cytochrome)